MGVKVSLKIDEAARRLHARLHSAGHLLDSSLKRIGYLDSLHLVPSKGHHFPGGAYVEYKGDIPENLRDKVQKELQEAITRMIEEDHAVQVHLDVPQELVAELCGCGPSEAPAEGPSTSSKRESSFHNIFMLSLVTNALFMKQ